MATITTRTRRARKSRKPVAPSYKKQRAERFSALQAEYENLPQQTDKRPPALVRASLKREYAAKAIAPMPSPTPDVQSAPDAREMTRDDVCNVERLTDVEERVLFRSSDAWEASAVSDGWGKNDYRWTLTPAQARKANRRRAIN